MTAAAAPTTGSSVAWNHRHLIDLDVVTWP